MNDFGLSPGSPQTPVLPDLQAPYDEDQDLDADRDQTSEDDDDQPKYQMLYRFNRKWGNNTI